MITPFRNNQFDRAAFIALLSMQPHHVVVCGSTGEGMLLTEKEREAVIQTALSHAPHRVIVGCGAPSTHQTLQQVLQAEKLGAHAALVVAPFYSRPQPDGVYEYFKHIHDHTHIPLILYNNPGRCGIDMTKEVIEELAKLPRIMGLKESCADMARIQHYEVSPSFVILCGEDSLFSESLHSGAQGIISVGGNFQPLLYMNMWKAWKESDPHFKSYARQVQMLCSILSPNPSAIKYALYLKGFCQLEYRSPITEPPQKTKEHIADMIKIFS